MKAVAPSGNRERIIMALYVFVFILISFAFPINLAFSQVVPQASGSEIIEKRSPDPLSDEALNRIAATIAEHRERKLNGTLEIIPGKQSGAGANQGLEKSFLHADVMYANAYFDTQQGTAFSFPEDTHDYCRAYFQNEVARQDFTLDATINAGAELSVELIWAISNPDQVTDFDLYLFDENGNTVGDAAGIFQDGFNGINYQTSSENLVENASVTNNGAGTENLYIVVDRFRGPVESNLQLTVSGEDNSFEVLEYIGDDVFSYFDAASGERIGTLTSDLVIDLSLFTSTPPQFTVAFETDDCAESLAFTLVSTDGQGVDVSSVDNDSPYTLFGEMDGDVVGGDLPDGTYELVVTPYSGDDASGAEGPISTLQFEITGNPVAADSARITGFSLADLSVDEANRAVRDITDNDVIDLPLLPIGLNIEAFLSDPASLATGVEFELFTLPLDANPDPVVVADLESLYLLFDTANGDTLSVGEYTLRATPIGAPDTDPTLLIGDEVSFTVLGPRISSYSFVDADNEQVISVLDSLTGSLTVDVSELPQNLNIRANTIDYPVPTIDNADFLLTDGGGGVIVSRIENFVPYSVFGDCNLALSCDRDLLPSEMPDYFPWVGGPVSGTFTLTGIPVNFDGAELDPQVFVFTITGSTTGQAADAPQVAKLLPNFPNPFNPVTTIRFGLPERMPVRVSVYDMLGREIKNLVDSTLPAGLHEVSFDAETLASGMYMYRLETLESVEVRLMTLLK